MTNRIVLVLVGTLAVVPGCSRVVHSEFPHVWVGNDANAAFMVQLTRNEGNLSGTFDQTSMDDSHSTTVTPLHAAFTGTIDGTAITLSFPGGFGFITNISGTLTASTMKLQVPQRDGSVAPITLTPGTPETYNKRADNIRASAATNASANDAALANAAAGDALQQQQQQISASADKVSKDIAAIRAALAQAPKFGDFETHLTAAANHLADTKADAGKAANESDPYTACSYAYDSQSDAYDVQSDAYSIDSDMYTVTGKIDTVNEAVGKLNKDLPPYTQAAAALPSYTPPNVPNTGEIKSLLSEAAKQTAAWKAKGTEYQSRVARLVTEANTIATQAQKQYC